MRRRVSPREVTRRLLRAPVSEQREAAIRRVIRQIPRGKVATYSQVAAAAGYLLYHRQVVQVLRKSGNSLPWQRVVGAGGHIRLKRDMAHEQRLRLELEGVRFRGRRVVMEEHQHAFRPWEFDEQPLPVDQPTHSPDGVDLTLIRWMLSMPPAERLDTLQQFVNSVLRIRAQNSKD
jgi:methylated-DNA-protein-cysteine methyltransferase-like protein